MENEEINNLVYSKNVIEFVTVANEYCLFLESISKIDKYEAINRLQKILPLLYLKASLLPEVESAFEEINEKFVTEQDWYFIHDVVRDQVGKFDEFLEVFDNRFQESDEPVVTTVSENIADIYQDIKDFIMLYRLGTIEYMNDALWECIENFKNIWGQKLVNVMRAVHNIKYMEDFEEEDDFDQRDESRLNTDNWFISKRQQESQSDEDF